ncbi:MAG: DNA primase [Chloroflexaceae bacterium]|nr:DNA primase [Chloroflexaceae bacterium]
MNVIDTIKERLDIVELIGASVALRKTGRSYLGFCPFHPNSRTPAFTVYPDTQSFYCFGCHASGSVFDFVMLQQGIDFREALQQLAQQAGVELQPPSAHEQQQDEQRQRLLTITAAAARYFHYMLVQHAQGQPGRDYVQQRGLDERTIEVFQLGYSLPEWDHLLSRLVQQKGFALDDIVATGLAVERDGRVYDRFRGRLIFPIRNHQGDVVGFGGRALDTSQPKYLNTPQTLLFDKSHVLYGLDQAHEAIRSQGAAVLVEGYVDVLTAHQFGFRNVVAPLGTALTAGHIGLLKKRSPHIYLALDADAAGQRATLRGIQAMQQVSPDDESQPMVTAQGLVRWSNDIQLRVIRMPDGRDPDDVIRADPEQWQALVAAARPVTDFYLESYTADLDLGQPQDQRTALERLIPLILELDSTQQRVYAMRLEQVLGIRADLILGLLKRNVSPTRRQSHNTRTSRYTLPVQAEPAESHTSHRVQPPPSRETYLLALLLQHPRFCPLVEEVLWQHLETFPLVQPLLGSSIEHLFAQTPHRQIWLTWQRSKDEPPANLPTEHVDVGRAWITQLPEPLQDRALALLTLDVYDSREDMKRQMVIDCARQLRLEQAQRWHRQLCQQVQDLADETESESVNQLFVQINGYLGAIRIPRPMSLYDKDLRILLKR